MKLTLYVPDGNKCTGCDFLGTTSREIGYNEWSDERYCKIFDNKITNEKCIACKMFEIKDNLAIKECEGNP